MPPKKDVPKVWLFTAAAVGVVGLSYAAYRFLFKSKVMSVNDVVKIMTDLNRAFEETMSGLQEMQQEMAEKARGMPRENVAELQRTFMETFRARITAREAEVCAANGVSPQELEAAVIEHRENPTVQYLVESLQKYYVDDEEEEAVDDADIPNLEKTIQVMSTMLELSIVVMEEVHKQVTAKLDPQAAAEGRKPKLTPQFVSTVNRVYAEQFTKVRSQVMQRMNITDGILAAASNKYMNEPEFTELIAKHKQEQARRFKALGLSQSEDDGDDE